MKTFKSLVVIFVICILSIGGVGHFLVNSSGTADEGTIVSMRLRTADPDPWNN